MTAYYNESDPYAAQWLRNLIEKGHIAYGHVDERSIEDVRPSDLAGYKQCHFFAGIGVWSYALRQAGWPDDKPVWTGSCPCQPFSAAGKGKGFADERHLWPALFHLIKECRPDVVFGEQVASKDGLGWLDLVWSDLEGEGYACGSKDTCAAGFGAPHIRQRLYWVANAESCGQPARKLGEQTGSECTPSFGGAKLHEGCGWNDDGYGGKDGLLANTICSGLQGHWRLVEKSVQEGREGTKGHCSESCDTCWVGISDNAGSQQGRQGSATDGHWCSADTAGCLSGLGDAERDGGYNGRGLHRGRDQGCERGETAIGGLSRNEVEGASPSYGALPTNGLWRDADWLFCRDGKWRPVEPSTFPLAHGATSRVGRLRAYGNALCAAQAQGFIEAYMEGLS